MMRTTIVGIYIYIHTYTCAFTYKPMYQALACQPDTENIHHAGIHTYTCTRIHTPSHASTMSQALEHHPKPEHHPRCGEVAERQAWGIRLSVYVCVCVYVCVDVYAYSVNVYMRIYAESVCIHACICMFIYACVYKVRMYTCVYVHIHTCVCTLVHDLTNKRRNATLRALIHNISTPNCESTGPVSIMLSIDKGISFKEAFNEQSMNVGISIKEAFNEHSMQSSKTIRNDLYYVCICVCTHA